MQQLSPLDSAFIYLESERTPMHIGGVYLIDRARAGDAFNLETVREHVRSRLQVARTFRQRLVEVPLALGHPFWIEDPEFDLDRHLPHHTLPEPGGKRELMELATEIFARPLDRERPLWEMAFVEGVDSYAGLSPGSVALIARVHHAAVDGMSGAEIMGALLDPTPEGRPPLPPDPWRPEPVPGGLALAARSYGGLGAKSLGLARTLGRTIGGAGKLVGGALTGRAGGMELPMRAPRTPLNATVTDRRSFGGVDFDLARVKALRSTVPGSTVNDVLLAVCSGALRDWLRAREALPSRSLVAMVPVSVRPHEDSGGQLGNQVSAMLVSLGTDEPDPHRRLAAIRASTSSAKSYGRALPANRLMDFVPSETAALASRVYLSARLAELHRPFFNLVITNVPGPQIPLYLAGAPIHGHVGMAPVFDGMGLILVIFSLHGRISIGITACRRAMPQARELESLLEKSLAALEREPALPLEEMGKKTVAAKRRSRVSELAALHAATDRLEAAIARLGSPDPIEGGAQAPEEE
jgi:WS/DGAT/MGAT family acyltransferase